ncbi:UNVERIFIED_CONTAM: 60S ribosomal protein L27a-2 [Sesamum calycinum]|uniref:60S ribosomal protein L27a-2 n=1 Tax=Sesamum calycinum TaxID=2727403 RepID=A0AAW2PNT2_9LAMI
MPSLLSNNQNDPKATNVLSKVQNPQIRSSSSPHFTTPFTPTPPSHAHTEHAVSSHDHPLQEEQEEARPCQRRARPHRETPQAPRRPWERRWHAPPPHPVRQVPPWILREGGHAVLHKAPQQVPLPIVNVDKLWSMIPQEVKDKASKDNVPLIDVTQFGYFKVLGKGALPENKPVVVKAKLVSKVAEKKIKEAGGAVVLTA